MKAIILALSAFVLWSCDDKTTMAGSSSTNSDCSEAGRSADALARKGSMVLVPAGCRNFTRPGSPPVTGNKYECAKAFWMDTVETSIAAYQSIMGSGEATLHNASNAPCPQCPMDNLTYFEAILLANARTKADLSPSDTVYSYDATVTSKTTNSKIRGLKPTEVTDLVNLRADTTRNGYRLPSRIEYSWAAVQDDFDHVGEDDSIDALYQWTSNSSGGTTHPVGQLLPNKFGIHDWDGNVWEWTSRLDSVDVGIATPNWRRVHVAIGGDYSDVSSATYDYRMPNKVQDETHAGVRFVRNADTASLSVGPRSCR